MTFRSCWRWIAGMLLLAMQLNAGAEDIDLFLGVRSGTSGQGANVLIIMDNTANWSSPFDAEKSALVSTFNSLPAGTVNVGVMMFTESGGANSGNDGAYVRAAIRNMDPDTRTKYANMISALSVNGDKSNSGKVGKAMQEAYLYFAGLAPYAGNNKAKTDYTGNASNSGSTADQAIWALTGNALSSKSGTRYRTPVTASTDCVSKNFIIYISNGAAQDSAADITDSVNALSALGGNTSQISISPVGSADNPADEWARFAKASALGITTYTLDVNKVTTGQGPGWTALLKSMANVSGGKYFDVTGTSADIGLAMTAIMAEIQSVNSVFASVSLPVSVNTQGTYLNQVFIGMFRPDTNSLPLWAGNLKQYKLGQVSGSLRLVDAAGTSAINSQTGFVTECARSFWTPTSATTDWAGKGWPSNTTFCSTASKDSDFPDGTIVEKGAESYMLRHMGVTRTVKTCGTTMATCASNADLKDFNTSNITPAQVGYTATTDRDNLVNWVNGIDVLDEDVDGNTTEVRRSIHGDVVHSRPVAVNFGTDSAPNVVVFYGANDGLFRAVSGNQTSNLGTTSIAAGQELWSFAPPEFYSKFKRLYTNTDAQRIKVPNDGSTTSTPKDYGMDGPITAFKGTIGGASKSFVYATMRRGGASLYGFDVTNALSTPNAPLLKWKIGCATYGSTDCTTGMGVTTTLPLTGGIGQTWSSAKVFTTSGYTSGGTTTPMLIFGGGYDTCEDSDPAVCNATGYLSKGSAVYVVDANSGAVLQTLATGQNRGIVADVTLVRDSNGNATYGYTADLGGNVYRITFGSGAPSSFSITRIASLGCANTSTCSAGRKFMFAPSVVASGNDYVIMLGSGDREKPLTYYSSATGTTNYFFQFTDKPTVSASTYPGNSDGCGSNIICLSSLYEITSNATPTATQLASKKGWALKMSGSEQVVTSAVTIFGVVTFSTHQPSTSTSTCSANLGTSRVYNIGYKDAASANGTTARWEHLSGDGLPPSPVAGMVELPNGNSTTTVPFCIGCSKDSPLESKQPTAASSVIRPKSRLYWYIQK